MKETFSTSDLGLATFLYTSGCAIKDVTYNNGRSTFLFQSQNVDINELVAGWQKGDCMVNAVAFFNNMAFIKRKALDKNT